MARWLRTAGPVSFCMAAVLALGCDFFVGEYRVRRDSGTEEDDAGGADDGALDAEDGIDAGDDGGDDLADAGDPGIPDEDDPDGDGGAEAPLLGVGSSSTSEVDYPRSGEVSSGDWYVDPVDGDDGNAGSSLQDAFATLAKALSVVSDGETILVNGGTLRPSSRYNLSSSLSAGINIYNYGSTRPVVEGSNLPGPGTSSQRVFNISGSGYHLKGFEVRNTSSESGVICVTGDHNIVEDFWVHDDPTSSGIYFYGTGAHDNLVLDCAVWRLGDGASVGTNTPDCLVVTGGAYNQTFVRIIAINGPDDNWDFFDGHGCTVVDCVSIGAGYYWNGTAGSESMGDGCGFKAGGLWNSSGDNRYRGCLAVGSRSANFSHNMATNAGIHFVKCTSVGSGYIGFDGGDGLDGNHNIMQDNVEHNSSDGSHYAGSYCDDGYNTWNDPSGAGGNGDFPIDDPQFASPGSGDWSLGASSNARGAASDGDNLGASEVALKLAKEWLAKGIDQYKPSGR